MLKAKDMRKFLFILGLFGTQTLLAQNFGGGPGSGYTENGTGMVAMPADMSLATSFTGVHHGSADWGDYDGDGRLDLLLTGFSSSENSNPVSKIFRNTISGFVEVFIGVLPQVGNSCARWGDFDNDGDLDIAIAGFDGTGPVSKLYENSTGSFVEIFPGALHGLTQASLLWVDLNNDGLKDLVMTGKGNDEIKVSQVFKNTGGGFSEMDNTNFAGVIFGSLAASDFDLDGDFDLAIAGLSDSGGITTVYLNQPSGFEIAYTGQLDNMSDGALAVADFNSDGRPDLFLSGLNNGTPVAKLYQNTGLAFSEVFPGSFSGLINNAMAWGDYDNDGDLDILTSGEIAPENFVTILYENVDTNFIEVSNTGIANVSFSSVAWADYDNDLDLDLLVCGSKTAGAPVSYLYNNQCETFNTSPVPPTNLSVSQNGLQLVFKWDKGSDAQTPANGLGYNLYVYDNLNETYIVAPHSNISNGNRLLATENLILWRPDRKAHV